jgi:hypothetical protein
VRTFGGCAARTIIAAADAVIAHSVKAAPCRQHSRQISSLYYVPRMREMRNAKKNVREPKERVHVGEPKHR